MAERMKLIYLALAAALVAGGATAAADPAADPNGGAPRPTEGRSAGGSTRALAQTQLAQTQPAQPAKPAPAQPARPAAAPGPYPTAVIDAFIGGCGRESGGRTEFCRCLIDGLQKKMSFVEFRRWETAGALGMQVPQAINEKVLDVATQCRWPD